MTPCHTPLQRSERRPANASGEARHPRPRLYITAALRPASSRREERVCRGAFLRAVVLLWTL